MNKGKFIVLMGVDGSGKSTVSSELKLRCKTQGIEVAVKHWRPHLLPPLRVRKDNDSKPNDRNAKKKTNKLVSVVRLIYYSLDFLLGYIFKIKKNTINGKHVIIERYYYDVVINPWRYNFYNSKLMDFFQQIIPNPDLIILLTVNPKLAFSRKGELNEELLKIDQDNYINYLNVNGKVTNVRKVFIDSSKEITEIIDDIEEIINKME